MTDDTYLIARLTDALNAAHNLLGVYGWQPFGSSAGDEPAPKLQFSTQIDPEDGLPYFERVIE